MGFIGFAPGQFWTSLYIQRVWHASSLKTALYLLPMAIGGISVNAVAAVILHRVSNKLLMFIGAASYALSFLLFALNRTSYGFWPMVFPALILSVVGADFEFNVTNVSLRNSFTVR
jgi:nitrate/nitrite transporter NarK